MANKKCKHNWHYVGTKTFKKGIGSNIQIPPTIQFATFICDICGKTKVAQVDGYLDRTVLNKDIRNR